MMIFERSILWLLSKQLALFLLIVSAFTWVSVLSQQISKFRDHSNISIFESLAVSTLRLPSLINTFFTVVFLVATLIALMHMVKHHELSIMRMAGRSPFRLALPIVVFGLAMGCMKISLFDSTAPLIERAYSNYKKNPVFEDFFTAHSLSRKTRTIVQMPDEKNVLIITEGVNAETQTLINPSLMLLENGGILTLHLIAEYATISEEILHLHGVDIYHPDGKRTSALSYPLSLPVTFDLFLKETRRINRMTPFELIALLPGLSSSEKRSAAVRLGFILAQPFLFAALALIIFAVILPCHQRITNFSVPLYKIAGSCFFLLIINYLFSNSAPYNSIPIPLLVMVPPILGFALSGFFLITEK
jgi:lipopolysaccharide export LptBFGC system permease protein LptF